MITYSKATTSDIAAIAVVHTKVFPTYFLTLLGVDLIEKYYNEFFYENNLFIVVKDDQRYIDKGIVGFCMGYYEGSIAKKTFEQKYKNELFKRVLFLCLKFNSAALNRIFGRIFSVIKKNEALSTFVPDVDLLSVGILEEYRGCGISGRLVNEFEKVIEEQNSRVIKNCALSVFNNNIRARKFYEKNGFEVLYQNSKETRYIKYYLNQNS